MTVRSMTIGRKLFLGFGAVIGLTSLLGLIALAKLGNVGDALTVIVNDCLPGVYLADRMLSTANDERSMMLTHLAADTKEQRTGFEAGIADHEKKFVALLKAYEKTIFTQRDREVYEKILPLHEKLIRAWAKIQPISRSGKTKQAIAMWTAEVAPLAAERAKAIETLSELNKAIGEANSEIAMKAQSSGRVWILCILITAVVAGCGIGFFIMKSTRLSLRKAVEELRRGSEQLTSASAQISSGGQALAQGTSEQAASLEETSASSQEMAAMTRKNANNSRQAADLMSVVDQRVIDANTTLTEMVASMNEINSSSDKISKIIKVIDAIAFQTNILALNAAVEAARAGEAGMGFAVVAEEVRNLAQRSAQAAKDTAALIEESIGRSNEGTAKLGKVEEAIRSITESAQKVKTLVDEVNLSSTEQARGSEQIANSIVQMEQVTQQAAANAEESAAAGEALNAQAKGMIRVVSSLRAMVDGDDSDVIIESSKPVFQPRKTHLAKTTPASLKALGTAVSRNGKASNAKSFGPMKPVIQAARSTQTLERDAFPMDEDFREF
jgi:methyl-accepting chemotaxis protein